VDKHKLLKFIITGVSSACAYFLLSYSFQNYLKWPPFIASNIAYMTTFCSSYLAQRNWTFASTLPHRKTLTRYGILQVFCSLVTGFVADASTKFEYINLETAVFVATIFAGILSYLLSTIWIFNHEQH